MVRYQARSRVLHLRKREESSVGNLTSNGRTTEVEWDSYSLVIKGQRVFIHSGEFHTFRLPVPGLWLDILQKAKAAGFNALSVYTHMALVNPSPGVIDFNDYRALEPLYEAAKQTGIFIVLRPGPYINAESTAGGIAHWITSQVAGELRTNATDWRASWQDYIQGIIDQTAPYQITQGGPVIDNEYSQSGYGHAEYFAELEEVFHNSSIVVPLTANDPGEGRDWVNGTGAVDIYGLDSYPQGFDCSNPTVWSPVVTNYYSYHESVDPSEPWYFPEFQGGSFDAWGPTAPGYDQCRVLTGADFENVFNLNLWASNAKLINYYMLYGGTSWGGLPFPGVYTSYDYGSAIAENRELTTKYPELKREGLFLRSSPEFYKTSWIGNSSTSAVIVSNSSAFVTLLRNPDTSTSFYIARQNDSTSTGITTFKLNVTTSAGNLEIPQVVPEITLGGRQSKLIVTDYSFGSSNVLYSTAQVLYAGQIGGRDVLYLYGDSTQEHEVSLVLTGTPRLQADTPHISSHLSTGQGTIISFLSGIEGLVTVWDSSEQLILYSDADTAGTFWSPEIPSNATSGDAATFSNYWQFGTNTSILVGGPYLVRNATITGSTLNLRGDLNDSVRLTVIAPETVTSITWNGMDISADVAATSNLTTQGGFVAQIQPASGISSIPVPTLSNWKYANSLPEIQSNFSDASWTLANHTTTNIPFKPYYGDGRVLYGCDYEYCENIVLWHGHFNATENTKSVNLSINGGEAFAASVWVNDVFLNTSYGNSTNNANIVDETDEKFYFPSGSLNYGQDNVITILQVSTHIHLSSTDELYVCVPKDNMGLDESGSEIDEEKSPRGVRGFQLNTGDFGEWKVQGKIGGYTNYPDKVRGVLNEGGLYGERLGWHLPGFDTSIWESRDITEGLPGSAAGVGFFVTTFDLQIPEYYDAPMSFTFDQSSQPYRVQLYVNGWMMGKRVANLGPQYKFPVHQGILNYSGPNTVAIALWAMEPTAISPTVALTVDGVFEGGVGGIEVNNPAWSPEGRQ
ncbi:glycoside hydrolase family 35 protein [Serpula lacrymans var. lacrymans S7.3]|uniref:beta-galactosidase n=2 Tax=Serpula lacrymans var. lacrymans TaxID=341189 RepID=F8QCG4_SERL3|nr:glycoside hydrolase family 35 protein [Serpula lacrymans var. lacrymans S7.9]EGN93829.1 glycoside hydrolase family 35 protein [Serpula lacrymans var. lacrymans S7.3]EGO19198.1 glycoside hydrolase family 35 protein [Serpula lacrymans var. lacrymans S7.9]